MTTTLPTPIEDDSVHQPETAAAVRQPVEQDRRRLIGRAAAAAGVAVAAARFLSVDLAGIVMNDSIGYLRRSSDPFGEGFVTEGYRQVAYPLTLWFSNVVGDVFGWDRVLGMALAQRLLLAVSIAAAVWALRWWSVPVVALATSSTFVVLADFVLPEGLLIPLSLLCGALLAAVVTERVARPAGGRALVIAICAVTVYASSIKLQYTALFLLAAAAALLLRRDGLVTRRLVTICFAAAISVVGALVVVQSIENRHEYGRLEPISERSLAEWYGAWVAVFGPTPERIGDPALAQWYDGGNLYTAFDELTDRYPDYAERSAAVGRRIDDMFEAVGTSRREEYVAAFLGVLRGGRTDDLAGEVDVILTAPPGDVTSRLEFNRLNRSGRIAELVELNDGRVPGFVSFGPVFDRTQRVAADHRNVKEPLAVVSIIVMALGLAVRGRHRLAAAAALLMIIGIAGVLATGFIDNARYLLGPVTILVIGATLTVRGCWQFAVARWRS